jgi:hypothetical protein
MRCKTPKLRLPDGKHGWRCFYVAMPAFPLQEQMRGIDYYIGFVYTNTNVQFDKLEGSFDVYANPNLVADKVQANVDAQFLKIEVQVDSRKFSEKGFSPDFSVEPAFIDDAVRIEFGSLVTHKSDRVLCFVRHSRQKFLDYAKIEYRKSKSPTDTEKLQSMTDSKPQQFVRYYARIQSLIFYEDEDGTPKVTYQLCFDPSLINVKKPIKIFDPQYIQNILCESKIKDESRSESADYFKHNDDCYVDFEDDVLNSIPSDALEELIHKDRSYISRGFGFECYKGYVMDVINHERFLIQIKLDNLQQQKRETLDAKPDFIYKVVEQALPDRVKKRPPSSPADKYEGSETESVIVSVKSKSHKPGVLSTNCEVAVTRFIKQVSNDPKSKKNTITFVCKVYSFEIRRRKDRGNLGDALQLKRSNFRSSSPAADDEANTFHLQSTECMLKISLIYGFTEIKEDRLTFDKDLFKESKDKDSSLGLMKFLHPDCSNRQDRKLWYTQEQRITYFSRTVQHPATLKQIIFGNNKDPSSVNFDIQCDNGETVLGGVSFNTFRIRPDLIRNPFDEKLVFPDNRTLLEITKKEYDGLITQRGEHWVSLPPSIYGAAVCFLIVNHENYRGICEQMDQVNEFSEEWSILEEDKKSIINVFRTRCVMLFIEIFGTFLIQGVLIYSVYHETPPQFDSSSGLCYLHAYVQLAAIATLTLWTISSYSDVWTELRCYISRTYIHDLIDSPNYDLRKIEKRSWGYHIAFVCIVSFETCITSVLYVAGVNFILTQTTAALTVLGILGISFITGQQYNILYYANHLCLRTSIFFVIHLDRYR